MTRRSSITTNTSRRSPPLPASRHNGSPSRARSTEYDRAVRPAPHRVERLPQQYFTALLAEVARHAALGGEPVVDLGRGNPEVGPPQHVIDALAAAANEPSAHGYPPFRGLPALREEIADRYSALYGVELDPHSEVTIVPGTKTAICELALVLAERGSTIVLPDPYYPDYPCGPAGTFAAAVAYAHETGAAIVHDFAYGDIVFDGRAPQSFLAEAGAREVGVEMFSMSKTYGMAGWRLGFVVGNAGIAALTGPQGSVAERVETYRRRRERVREVLPDLECEGSFYLWWELPDGLMPVLLLGEHRLAVAPGEGFGSRGAGWARLSLAVTDEVLETGLERLAHSLSLI